MLRFILSIDALRRSRATSILLSYDSVLEVKVNCNEECALRSEAGKRIEMSPKSRGSSLMLLGNVTDLLNSTVSLPGILAGVLYDVEALLEKVITLRQATASNRSCHFKDVEILASPLSCDLPSA